MITAAEGQELLGLIRSAAISLPGDAWTRLRELVERVAHDAEVEELSRHLEALCAQLEPDSDFPDPVLLQEIRNVAERLAELAP